MSSSDLTQPTIYNQFIDNPIINKKNIRKMSKNMLIEKLTYLALHDEQFIKDMIQEGTPGFKYMKINDLKFLYNNWQF